MRRSRRDFLMQQNTDYPRKKGTRTVNRSSTACVACRKRKSKVRGIPVNTIEEHYPILSAVRWQSERSKYSMFSLPKTQYRVRVRPERRSEMVRF